MSKNKCNRLNINSLKSNIIIGFRDKHITDLVDLVLTENYSIIPLEWLDEKIRLECIINHKDYIINEEIRKQFLINIFMKECKKDTAKLISEL